MILLLFGVVVCEAAAVLVWHTVGLLPMRCCRFRRALCAARMIRSSHLWPGGNECPAVIAGSVCAIHVVGVIAPSRISIRLWSAVAIVWSVLTILRRIWQRSVIASIGRTGI